MKKPRNHRKGPWIVRAAIVVLAALLGLLLYWLLGFVVDDIGAIRGPLYEDTEVEFVDSALLEQRVSTERDLERVQRRLNEEKRLQTNLREGTKGLQQTINQLLELQQLSLTNQQVLTEDKEQAFSESFDLFLANQTRSQQISQRVEDLIEQEISLETELRQINQRLETQREPARKAFQSLAKKHRNKLAALQLAVLMPLLVLAGWGVVRMRQRPFAPAAYAFGAAVLVKVLQVLHTHFPPRAFRYLLIITVLAVVVKLLSKLIRALTAPAPAALTRQYRDAYQRFLCPVCEHPIQQGALRFAFWTRRTAKRLLLARAGAQPTEEEGYTCPSCGTVLFEECPSCQRIRHALLPHCRHCGAEHEVAGGQ